MILDVQHVSFAYHNHTVLNDLSFSLDEGEVVCLLGQNGAGKTTLFKCVLGFFKNFEGDIFLGEKSLRTLNSREIAQKIAYIPQAHDSTYNYPVSDVVLMGTSPLIRSYATPGENERKIVEETLDFLNISHLADRGYTELSGGEQQLVLIARAVAQKSKLLIMDEPTANLDYGNQQRIMSLAKSLSKEGYTILLSTHNPEHALHFSDKALILQKGQSLQMGTPEEIITSELLLQIYGIEAEVLPISSSWGTVQTIVPKI